MKVYRNEIELYDLVIDSRTSLQKRLMAEDKVVCNISLLEKIDLLVGDYILINGIRYSINRPVKEVKNSVVEYRYTIEFEAPIYKLLDKLYMLGDSSQFFLVGTAEDFINLLLDNINSLDPGWTKGTIWNTSRKNLSFNCISCREALNQIASEFTLEYDVIDKQISLKEKIENPTVLTFEHGKGKGLYNLSRESVDDENTVTRVFVFGSSRNLEYNYRGGSKRLIFENPDGSHFLENTSEYNRIVEKTVVFEDIWPRFTGVVNTVSDDKKVITCPEIDFDLNNQLLSGITAKVIFLTGDLMGVQFEIVSFNEITKQITLKSITQEGGMLLPDSTTFFAKPGDEFTFTDIRMPESYIQAAEVLLKSEGQKWLDYYSQLRVKYSLVLDHRFIRDNSININVGNLIRIIDQDLNIDKQIRILGFTKNLDGSGITAEISNYRDESISKKVRSKLSDTINQLSLTRSEIQQVQNNNAGSRLTGGTVSKIIPDLSHAPNIDDSSKMEVHKAGVGESQYIEASQIAEYIKSKFGVTITDTKTIWDRDMHIVGNFTASREIAAWIAEAIESDIFNNLMAVTPLRKQSANTLVFDFCTSHFEVVGGVFQMKAGVLSPAQHYHPIAEVTGLQGALDSKEPAITAGTTGQYLRGDKTWQEMPTSLPASDVFAWAKSATKPVYNFAEIENKPTTLIGYGITDAWLSRLSWDATNNRVNISSPLHLAEGAVVAYNKEIKLGTTNGGADTPYGGIIFQRYWNGTTDYRASYLFHFYNSAAAMDYMAIAVASSGSPRSISAAKMVVGGNGFVGIGTFLPQATGALLSVMGKVTGTGFVKHGGTSSQFLKADGSIDESNYILNTDARLTDARQASDVYAWAKEATKPSYAWSEIGSKPTWESKMGWDAVNSRVTINSDVFVTGNILATKEIAAWIAGAIESDVLANLTASVPLYKSSATNIQLLINSTHFEVNASNQLQIKAGVLSPAQHYHAISDITGLQGSLDGKAATHTHPYLSDSDARISQWSTAYGWGNHASAGYLNLSSLSYGSWKGLRVTTASGYIEFGPANGSYAHIYTNTPYFYFNKDLLVNGGTVWHTGNFNPANYLTAESDTLASVTARGNAASAGIQVGITGAGTQNSYSIINNGGDYLRLNGGNGYATSGYIWLQNGVSNVYINALQTDSRIYLRGGVSIGTESTAPNNTTLLMGGPIDFGYNGGAVAFNRVASTGAIYNGSYGAFQLWHTDKELHFQTYNGANKFRFYSDTYTDGSYHATNNVNAYAYYGNGNVAGTGSAIYCPNGIYAPGTLWLYGRIYGNANTASGFGMLDSYQFQSLVNDDSPRIITQDTRTAASGEFLSKAIALRTYNDIEGAYIGLRHNYYFGAGANALVFGVTGNEVGRFTHFGEFRLNGGATMTSGWNRTLTLSSTFPGIVFNSANQKWASINYDYSSRLVIRVGATSEDTHASGTIALGFNAGNGFLETPLTMNGDNTRLRLLAGGYGGSYNSGLATHTNATGVLQLGNNGTNYIVGGTTVAGGVIQFWTNNTNDVLTSGISPNGYNNMTLNADGTVSINSTIYLAGANGLYSPSVNSATFYPNNGTYGSWKVGGSRNSWNGLEFESGVSLMMNSADVGFHRNGYGWQIYWSGGTLYCFKGSPGGGTQATVVDTSNISSLTFGNITAYDFILSSDARKKKDIEAYKPVRLNTTYKAYKMIGHDRQRFGLVAQELLPYHSEHVTLGTDGFYKVHYMDIFSREISWLKHQESEHERRIQKLEFQIKALQDELTILKRA